MPLAEFLIGGILLGGVYALMACGLNLIFGVMRVINFAHGDILAVAALSTVSIVVGFKLPFWLAVVVVPLGCALLGVLIHLLVLRRIEGAPMIMSLLATYALSTIIVNVAILIWGGGYSGLPGVLSGSIRLLGVNVSVSRLVSFACAISVSLAVWWLLQFTRFGRAIRSASQAPELASISGIAVDQVRLATFALVPAWPDLPACWSRRLSPSIPSSAPASSSRRSQSSSSAAWAAIPAPFWLRCCSASIEVVGSYFAGAVIGSAFLFLLMLGVLGRPRGLLGAGVRI